jgi:ribonuclease HI
VLEYCGQHGREDFGGERDTSNNRMEMRAIIEALNACGKASEVIVRTDSQLVVLCAVGRWKKRANLDLWAEMADLCRWRSVVFEWWRGHSGTPGNERADYLANQGRLSLDASYDAQAMAHLRAIASGT